MKGCCYYSAREQQEKYQGRDTKSKKAEKWEGRQGKTRAEWLRSNKGAKTLCRWDGEPRKRPKVQQEQWEKIVW